MALTTIDATPALVVIDLQKGIVALPTAHPAADVVRHSAELAAAFRRRGFPVVLVNVEGGAPGRTEAPPRGGDRPADWAELVAALDPQPDDLRVTKRTWGAFHGTTLDAQLRARGVTQVVRVAASPPARASSRPPAPPTSTATTSSWPPTR